MRSITTTARAVVILYVTLLVVICLVVFRSTQVQSAEVDHLILIVVPVIDTNIEIFRDMTEAQNAMLRYQLSRDLRILTTYRDARVQILSALEPLHIQITKLMNHKSYSSGELVTELEAIQKEAIKLWMANALKSERAVLNSENPNFTQNAKLFEDFRQVNSRLDELFKSEISEARRRTRDASSSGTTLVLIVAVASSVIMLVFGLRIARSISRPIIALSGTIKLQREGDTKARARVDLGSAEIRSLAVEFNSLTDVNLESRRRIEDLADRFAKSINLSKFLGEKYAIEEVLPRIIESARELIGAQYGGIVLLGPNGEGFTDFAMIGFNPKELAIMGDAYKALGPLPAEFDVSKNLRLEHLADHPLSAWLQPGLPPVESYLAVPIKSNEETIGRFFLANGNAGTFSAEDEQVAEAISLLAAVAINTVQRFDTERKRASTLARIRNIEHSIHVKSITERPLDVMCVSLGTGLKLDRVIIRIIDGNGVFQLTNQWHREGLQSIGHELVATFPSVENLAKVLWMSASVRIVDDYIPASGPVDNRVRSYHQITGARAAIFAPIGTGDRVLGLLTLLMVDGPRTWTEAEAEVLKQVANYVATTIVDDEHQENQRSHIVNLEQLERQKSNFLATVSHELRTPLTSIIGYLELLQEGYAGTINDEQKHMLEVMNRNSDRLQALIENLLVISRIEGSEVAVTRSGISICDLIATTCEEFLPLAKSRGISFEVNPGPNTAIVKGDERQLRSVIANVVSNAIKFSHIGGLVKISCAVDSATQTVEVTCIDVGIGIPLADQGNLFVRFFRAGNAVEKQIPGTGLGLSIVELIVREHGGHIRLASTEGEGTTVVIDFPLSTQDSF